ncbi:MAG: putative toxin-antitoxin system toxin component, PIN family [Planctomycetaceae bacterium]
MPRRKWRIPIVLDTNVFASALLSGRRDSVNVEVVRLWRNERKLQLIVCDNLVAEYAEVFERIGIETRTIELFLNRLQRRDSVTHVRLGPRFNMSRDPDDNVLLATARVGLAKYLVTQDRDLLDIPMSQRRLLKFQIVTPAEFLEEVCHDL